MAGKSLALARPRGRAALPFRPAILDILPSRRRPGRCIRRPLVSRRPVSAFLLLPRNGLNMFLQVSISPSHPMRCAPMPCPVLPCSLRPRNGHDSAEFGNAIQNYYEIFGFDSQSRPRQRIGGGPLRLRTQVESPESARFRLRDLPQSLSRSHLRAGFAARLSRPPPSQNGPRMIAFLQSIPAAFLSLPLRGGTRQDAASPSRGGRPGGRTARRNIFAITMQIYACPVRGLPWRGKLGSLAWKNGENDFHGVEVFRKVASMAWKNGETGFHGVEGGLTKGRRAG